MPSRLQLKRTKGYRLPAGAVCVTRSGRWGNPFVVGGTRHVVRVGLSRNADGSIDVHEREFETDVLLRGDAVHNFVAWLNTTPSGRALAARAKRDLRGLDLACYCRLCPKHANGKPLGVECPDCQPCHADVLLEMANAPEVLA